AVITSRRSTPSRTGVSVGSNGTTRSSNCSDRPEQMDASEKAGSGSMGEAVAAKPSKEGRGKKGKKGKKGKDKDKGKGKDKDKDKREPSARNASRKEKKAQQRNYAGAYLDSQPRGRSSVTSTHPHTSELPQ
ncbi:unnamed protein product, partial [Scytosiphon promiscuus]